MDTCPMCGGACCDACQYTGSAAYYAERDVCSMMKSTNHTDEDTIRTHVADKVVEHKAGRRDIAYMSPDKATWSDAQLALHEACQAAYITFAQLENAWYLTGKSDHAIGDESLAAYAAWQRLERIARPYFPDL